MDAAVVGLGTADLVALGAMTSQDRAKGDAGQYWQRVADLRLRLSPDAEIVRQEIREQLWYIVRDRLGDRFYRISPSVYLFLAVLDGTRTVDEAYDVCFERLGDDAPAETEIIRLLWRLHTADLLKGDVAGRTEDLVARAEKMAQNRFYQQLRTPLAIRIPLFDPDKLLDWMRPLSRYFFSGFGFLVWLIVCGVGLGYVAVNWSALGANFSDRVLAFDNLIIITLIFPVIKALHEIGHGLALKRWDCESHETGIMFLVFMPVPYIDASSSVKLGEPWRRAIIGAAGLYVELFIAALAAIAWAHMEPGVARAIAFNVMIIGGASAVLFNGNPLLKFDAYYVLSDAIEIPNLAQRANEWWLYQIQTHLLGIETAQNPVEVPGERPWFMFYAPAAIAYRMFLISIIILFISKQAFFLGIILAAMAVANILLFPLYKGLKFLLTSPRLKTGRPRAILVTVGTIATLAVLLFAVPVPNRTVAHGVVWYSEGAELRPLSGGTVVNIYAKSGQRVIGGASILEMEAPEIDTEIDALNARLAALEAQRRRELVDDRERATLTAEEIIYIRKRLSEAQTRREGLTLVSPVGGVLVIPDERDIADGWIRRGQSVGHVVGDAPMIVRVALTQADLELVTERLDDLQIRLAGHLGRPIAAEVIRSTPEATDVVPAMLLSIEGGGPFSMRPPDPGDPRPRAIETLFVLELSIPEDAPARFGERAYVLFDHGREALSLQWQRSLRQMLLREFNV